MTIGLEHVHLYNIKSIPTSHSYIPGIPRGYNIITNLIRKIPNGDQIYDIIYITNLLL
jgi:hypothetical protein